MNLDELITHEKQVADRKDGTLRTLDELIKHYEGEVAEYEDGTLMSTGEMVHGRYWSKKILGELKALRDE